MRLSTNAFDYGMLPSTRGKHALRPSQGDSRADVELVSNRMSELGSIEHTGRSFRSLKGALMFELHNPEAKGKLPRSYRARR
jgi:hypothetical protein